MLTSMEEQRTHLSRINHSKNSLKHCDIVYAGTKMEKRYMINPNKLKQFMLYVAFRQQKKRRRRKKGKDIVIFDLAEWNRITTLFVENSQNAVKNLLMKKLVPKTGVDWNVLNYTKAALRQMWLQQ